MRNESKSLSGAAVIRHAIIILLSAVLAFSAVPAAAAVTATPDEVTAPDSDASIPSFPLRTRPCSNKRLQTALPKPFPLIGMLTATER